MVPKKRIVCIIPTLNEEPTISSVIKEIPRDRVNEIVVVDSSIDATPEIARGLGAKVMYEYKKGKGRALRAAFNKLHYDIYVIMDGDYTYNPKEIHNVIRPIIDDEADIVLGSRILGKIENGAIPPLN